MQYTTRTIVYLLLKPDFNTASIYHKNVLSVSLNRFHDSDIPAEIDDSMFGTGGWRLSHQITKQQDLCDPVSVS